VCVCVWNPYFPTIKSISSLCTKIWSITFNFNPFWFLGHALRLLHQDWKALMIKYPASENSKQKIYHGSVYIFSLLSVSLAHSWNHLTSFKVMPN
jgi:hypothetical protein